MLRAFLSIFVIFAVTASSAQADLINGDFSDGLNGWTTYQLNESDFNPDDPFASFPARSTNLINDVNGQAEMAIIDGDDAFVVSLSQWLQVEDTAETIRFEFKMTTSENPPDPDYFTWYDFLSVGYQDDDPSGAFDAEWVYLDPIGAYDSNYNDMTLASLDDGWLRFETDISGLRGRTGTIYFDLVDNWDGLDATALIDNVSITTAPAPVPEPATILLLGIGLTGVTTVARRKKHKSEDIA